MHIELPGSEALPHGEKGDDAIAPYAFTRRFGAVEKTAEFDPPRLEDSASEALGGDEAHLRVLAAQRIYAQAGFCVAKAQRSTVSPSVK